MLEPGDRIGDWVVDSALGEGGMGAVYRAHNALVPDIVAAVKILKPHALEDARERFFREVQAVHRLHHPNIVRVTGFGEDQTRGLLWMAMDLVEGGELSDRIQRGPTSAAEALALFDGLVDALAHAHGLGVFHRDLKPGNVLVDAEGRAKLVDFGIAVQQGQARLTSTGLVVGTPAYLPPEVFDADSVDPGRADVYAIGQMLHEVLIGAAAFPEDPTLSEGQRMGRLLAAKIKTTALDPGESFSPQLRALVREATEPDPADRIPSAEALRERIRRMAPETQWVRLDRIDSVAAPTYEPDDGPVVAGTTVGGGFDPNAAGTTGGRLAAPTMSLEDDLGEAPPKKRRGWLRWVLVAGVLLVLGGTALVAAGGAAGAGAWYFGYAPDVPDMLDQDLISGLSGGGIVPAAPTDTDGTDTDMDDTDAVDTAEAETDAEPEDTEPPEPVQPDPDPDTEPGPTVRTDVTKTRGFQAGWARSAAMLQKCEELYSLSGGGRVIVGVVVTVERGRVVSVSNDSPSLPRDTAICIERAARAGRYGGDVTGFGRVPVRLEGAIRHEGPPDPDPTPVATLDQATVTRTVTGNGLVRRCLAVLAKEAGREATAKLTLAIQPDGKTSNVRVELPGTPAERASRCLTMAGQRMAFPASQTGGTFQVELAP